MSYCCTTYQELAVAAEPLPASQELVLVLVLELVLERELQQASPQVSLALQPSCSPL
jgi:hypothetical protein